MASPQKENGYTPIANELLEAFMRLNLSEHSWRVLFCIIRYSYGWNKKEAKLTCSQIAQLTGIDIRLIPRTLKSLQNRNIIVRDKSTLRLQKDYHKWVFISRDVISRDVISRDVISRDVISRDVISRDDKSSSVEMINIISRDDNFSCKPAPDKDLRRTKDILKYNKDISLREKLLEKLKNYFPDTSIPVNVPNKKIDFFLYLIEQNRINPSKVENPVRYIQSNKLVIEPFPSLLEREAEREKLERARIEKLNREREELKKLLMNENRQEMKRLIGEFRAQLEDRNAVSV